MRLLAQDVRRKAKVKWRRQPTKSVPRRGGKGRRQRRRSSVALSQPRRRRQVQGFGWAGLGLGVSLISAVLIAHVLAGFSVA